MGLTTNVSENNSTVQDCVNITHGTVESSDNSVYPFISTSPSFEINSATGKYVVLLQTPSISYIFVIKGGVFNFAQCYALVNINFCLCIYRLPWPVMH